MPGSYSLFAVQGSNAPAPFLPPKSILLILHQAPLLPGATDFSSFLLHWMNKMVVAIIYNGYDKNLPLFQCVNRVSFHKFTPTPQRSFATCFYLNISQARGKPTDISLLRGLEKASAKSSRAQAHFVPS